MNVPAVALPYDFYVGLDLGQLFDYTALAVLEEPVHVPAGDAPHAAGLAPPDTSGWVSLDRLTPAQQRYWRAVGEQRGRPPDPPLLLRHLERHRGVSYVDIAARVQRLLTTPPLSEANVVLLADATGVGRGVTDLLAARDLAPVCVTIHGGNEVHADLARSELHVPKRELILSTQLALQQQRLRIAAGLEHAVTLTDELKTYQVKVSAAGHDSYSAREGAHDDLVLAAALAVWFRGWYAWHLDARHRAPRQSAEVA